MSKKKYTGKFHLEPIDDGDSTLTVVIPREATSAEARELSAMVHEAQMNIWRRMKDDEILRQREDHEQMIRDSDRIRAERATQ